MPEKHAVCIFSCAVGEFVYIQCQGELCKICLIMLTEKRVRKRVQANANLFGIYIIVVAL